ncbi:dihydrofolate reductase family protein [Streptomyces albus]|uniref:dihydrofolate reductase family protein n=1 Tax=Streptomyces albus TaxID=1888 RepID=UPI0033E96FA0
MPARLFVPGGVTLPTRSPGVRRNAVAEHPGDGRADEAVHVVGSGGEDAGEDPAVQVIGDRPPAEVVRELKQQDGADIWLVGGGKLAAALLDEIDELIVKRSPRVACAGIPLFDGEFTPTAFVPVAAKEFASGITRTTYVRER